MTRFPTYQLPPLPRLPKLPRLPGQQELVSGARQTTPLPELTEEEERSITGGLLSTIEYVGESLDKPGAALRGVLAGGGAEQLLHLIPFSDALGIAPEKRYSGRELLEGTGLIGANQTGLDAGDVAGFGAEVLLDPTWLLGIGELNALGKVAKAGGKAAKVAKTFEEAKAAVMPALEAARAGRSSARVAPKSMAAIADQIRAGERSLLSIGLPGTSVKAHFGAGSEAAARLYETIGYGGGKFNPLVWTRGLFSSTSGARTIGEFMAGGGLQKARDLAAANKQLLEDVIVDFMPHLKERSGRLSALFDNLTKHHGEVGDEMAAFEFAREALEAKGGIPQGDELLGLIRKHAGIPADADLSAVIDNTEALATETASYLDALQTLQKSGYARISELGGNAPLLNDIYIGHNARRGSELLRMSKREQRLMRSSGYRYWMNRKHLGDVPGGAPTINAIARDWTLTGTKGLKGAEKKALREELRTRLTGAGVGWQEDDFINVLQELWLWHGHLKEPFERTWATSQVDELGQLLDDAGNVRSYTRGPWKPTSEGKVTPITRATEETRWLEGVLESTVATGGKVAAKATDPEVTRLARYFRHLDPEVRAKGIFDKDPIIDTFDYLEALAEQESTLRSIDHFMGQKGVVRLADAAEMTGGEMTDIGLRDAIHKIRIGTAGGRKKGRCS